MVDWLDSYYKDLEEIKKKEREEFRQNTFKDLKKKLLAEKREQISDLEKKLVKLRIEINAYEGAK